ncbi:MAG: hypothetical protein J1G06_00295 [Oscillospiraceae bacterium]|nr:hypothetical protein [Oscillospiraceae bacterium]
MDNDFAALPLCDRLIYCSEICKWLEKNLTTVDEYMRSVANNDNFIKVMKSLYIFIYKSNPEEYILDVTNMSEEFRRYADVISIPWYGTQEDGEFILRCIDKILQILYEPAVYLADKCGMEKRFLNPMIHSFNERAYFSTGGKMEFYSTQFPYGNVYTLCSGYIDIDRGLKYGDPYCNEAHIFIGKDGYDSRLNSKWTLVLDFIDTEDPDNPNGISDKDISQLYSFMNYIKGCSKITVGSLFGNSASSAVAAAIVKYLGGNERPILTSKYDAVNMYVYNKIIEYHV